MKKSEYPLLHIHTQSSPRSPLRIIGNTEGLLTLVTTLIEATSIIEKGSGEAFCVDGEAYEIQILRDDSDSAWDTLELPYNKNVW